MHGLLQSNETRPIHSRCGDWPHAWMEVKDNKPVNKDWQTYAFSHWNVEELGDLTEAFNIIKWLNGILPEAVIHKDSDQRIRGNGKMLIYCQIQLVVRANFFNETLVNGWETLYGFGFQTPAVKMFEVESNIKWDGWVIIVTFTRSVS